MKKQHIVIVGGGFAGVKAALDLGNNPHFEVTLITPHSRFEYHGAMYRSATGRSPLEVVIPMSEIFKDIDNVTVQLDSMVELRPETNEIEGESGRVYNYDILIMAVGYVVNYFGIKGMAEHSESMYNISQAVKLRHRLVGEFRRASQTKEPIQITVIGAGPTGIELVSDVLNFSKIVEGRHGLRNLDVKACLVEAADRVLPALSHESSEQALQRLQDIGVNVHLNTMVTECGKDFITTNVDTMPSNITIWTAGNKANPLFAAYPDVFTISDHGRVAVDGYFQTNKNNIYVIGDAADTTYSGMAQTAIHNAIALTKNLIATAEGKETTQYQPKRPTYVVPIGGEWALLETEESTITGEEGWKARRDADMWVLENFLVYELAEKHYKQGEKIANF